MSTLDNLLKALVLKKLVGNVSTVNYTGGKELHDGNTFFFQKGPEGWTVYEGCELVVGDTTLDYCCQCVNDVIECGHR